MKKQTKEKQLSKLLSQAESTNRRNRVILFGVILIIELALIGMSLMLKWFTISDFFVDIINNIIGILPPILLFDFFYEKISSEASSIETSKKITSTMMGQPETLKLFNIEDRKKFLYSTVNSVISDPDLTDMILDNVNRYVIDPSTLNVRIRKEFSYNFELNDHLPQDYSLIFKETEAEDSKYFFVQQILNYTAKQFKPDMDEGCSVVAIGFLYDNVGLDEALRDKIKLGADDGNDEKSFFVFREGIDLSREHLEQLVQYLTEVPEETKERFMQISRLSLKINGKFVELHDVIVGNSSIICKFKLEEKLTTDDYSVRVIFSLPKKWGSVIEVALVDPTYAPKITLSYPRDKMKVEMYSFLNKSDTTSLNEAHEQLNGIFDVSLNEWVYPMSGMIFTVDKNKKFYL